MTTKTEENKTQESNGTLRKVYILLATLLIATLAIISLAKFGSLFPLLMVYWWVTSVISGIGLNDYVVRFIAIPVALISWFVVFKLALARQRYKRYAGIVLLAIFFMTHTAFMFTMTKDDYFVRVSGASAKYYTINPLNGKISLFEQPIYDDFGNQALPLTPEIAQEIEARRERPSAEIAFEDITMFFDRITGKPLIYYGFDYDGNYVFYVKGGYSPITGERLLPVTKKALDEIKAKANQKTANALKIKEQSLQIESLNNNIAHQNQVIEQLQDQLVKTGAEVEVKNEVIGSKDTQLKRYETDLQNVTQQTEQLMNRIQTIEKSNTVINENAQEMSVAHVSNKEPEENELAESWQASEHQQNFSGLLINKDDVERATFVLSNDIQSIAYELKPRTVMVITVPIGSYDWKILQPSVQDTEGTMTISITAKPIPFDKNTFQDFTKVTMGNKKWNDEHSDQYVFELEAQKKEQEQ